MKRANTFLLILLLFWTNTYAGSDLQKNEQVENETKEERIRKKWNKLTPKQLKLQYAGSMGFMSTGVGWYYGKRKQWETDIFLGYIPRHDNMDSHMTFTIKQAYTPWVFDLNEKLNFEPLISGIYMNKIFGEYFWHDLPERYPNGYYFWALDTRFNIFIGQSLTFKLDNPASSHKAFSLFYELSTNDLYVISAIGNKTVSAKNILGLSFGLRYRFF